MCARHARYGTHAIGDCWLPAVLVGSHCLLALLMESIFIGIVFSKISHPKVRGPHTQRAAHHRACDPGPSAVDLRPSIC